MTLRQTRPVVLLAMAATALTACAAQSAPARCAAPAHLPDGSYSSYRTAGTMPDGTTVHLSDGDSWTCHAGTVTVH